MPPISFPYPVWGHVYNSNNKLVGAGITITATGDTTNTDVTNADSKYIIDLMGYASSGGNVTIICNHLGETISSTFKLIVSNPGKNLDIVLMEAINAGDIYVNTHNLYGNELYINTPYNTELWCKTSDY